MDRLFMKKVIIIFIVFLFVITSFGFVQGIEMQENSVDVIDQSNGGSCGGCSSASALAITDGVYIAQGFTPTHNTLSKIVLLMKRLPVTELL